MLNLSRALGDLRFKNNSRLCSTQQAVTAVPDVACVELQPDHEFLVIASDGVFDVLNSKQVVDFVRSTLVLKKVPVLEVAEKLLRQCMAPGKEGWNGDGTGTDNATVVIVDLQRGHNCLPQPPPSAGPVPSMFKNRGCLQIMSGSGNDDGCFGKRVRDVKHAFFPDSNKKQSLAQNPRGYASDAGADDVVMSTGE